MRNIEEILQLPKEEQVAIMEAIQDNLDSFFDNETLSEEHTAFIKERIQRGETSDEGTYTWQRVKEQLKNRWNTK